MKTQIIITLVAFSISTTTKAQLLGGLENILFTSTEDARLLAEGYTAPLGKALTYGLNSGWATSAKTHKKLGFGLAIAGAIPFVPEADQSFTPTDLTSLNVPSGSLPTIFGEGKEESLNFSFKETILNTEQEFSGEFRFPGGMKDDLPFGTIPAPIIQASVGVVFDTDLLVRFVPSSTYQGSSFRLTGFGLKHNIMQYFGPLDRLPLNVSVLAAFSQANFEYNLAEINFAGGNENQKMSFEADTFTVQALASVDLPIISVFAGLGYNSGTSHFDMTGDYELDYNVAGMTVLRNFKDPISTTSESTGVMGVIGGRLNLLFLKIFANYTIQEYNTLTAGISFNFR
jgi:hypothetical protein